MKKRTTAILLASAMAVTSLAGCAGSTTAGGDSKETGQSTQAAAGKESSGDTGNTGSGEKTKLKAVFVSHALTKSVEDMKWLQELEDQCNVEIEWEQIYQDWETVKSTRFASGDIPDILFNATTDSDYTKYSGLFQDMSELIDSDAPNIKEMFNNEPDTKILAQTPEGQIYGIPKCQSKWPDTNTVLFINKQWLDNLGLQEPKTFTELETVLKAFKEQDANGNGDPGDEIPLDFNAYGGNNAWFNSAYSLLKLLPSMGIQMTDIVTDGYFAEDAKVKCFAVDERYKLFMKYLNRLYTQGLINSNAITNDYSAFQSLSRGNEKGEAVVGCVFGWEETDKFGPDLYSQYTALAPLEYDVDCAPGTYDTRWSYDFDQLNMQANRVAMSAKCENKNAAMKFIDGFYDKTKSVETLFGGISDGCLEKTDDHNFKVLPPMDSSTDPGTWKWTNTFADFGPFYIRKDCNIEMSEDMNNALKEREVYKDALAKVTDQDYYPQLFMKYSEEEQNTMALTQANINNIIDNYWSLWMTGESDIDADWDSYVKNVEAAGLKEVLNIRQKAFDNYLAK